MRTAGRAAWAAEMGGEEHEPDQPAGPRYRAALTREVSAGVSYQPIFNPAYNADRSPVHVLTGRVHVAF